MTRYILIEWTDADDYKYLHTTHYVHTDCAVCHGVCGAFFEGEAIIDDTQSIDLWHVRCAPARVRALSFVGTVVRAFRVVMGIDRTWSV